MRHNKSNSSQSGMTLLGTMVIALALVIVSVCLLELLRHESLSVDAGIKSAVAMQLADAAGEIVIGWFHDPLASPPAVSLALTKRFRDAQGTPTFFDQTGRSQFIGSAERPDVLLDKSNPNDDRILNDPTTGIFKAMASTGIVDLLKIYAPSRPGLLCTVEVTVETRHPTPFRQSISMQLEAVELPALRMALQAGRNLHLVGNNQSTGGAHWAPVTVGGNLVVRRLADIPMLDTMAPITGRSYDESLTREDRWAHLWIGRQLQAIEPPADSGDNLILPSHVHDRQNPTPGVPFDQWSYEVLKRTAMKFGSYYGIDREGMLYQDGIIAQGHGISPDHVFSSRGVGDQLGLIFVDTLDQRAPHGDNLGTVTLSMAYFEGVAVIQGHVLLQPSPTAQRLLVRSPSPVGNENPGRRETVQLTGVQLNGVLYAAGNISIERTGRVFGAVIAEGDIQSAVAGATLEVWHDDDMSRGLFRGIPLVARAPGTWLTHF